MTEDYHLQYTKRHPIFSYTGDMAFELPEDVNYSLH